MSIWMTALDSKCLIREVSIADTQGGSFCAVGWGAIAKQGSYMGVILQACQNDVQLHSLQKNGQTQKSLFVNKDKIMS